MSLCLFESFRTDLNEAKAVSCNVVNYLTSSVNISHLPLCNYDAPIRLKFRVTSLTINSHRGRRSQVSQRPCVIEKRDKG